jgi:hypothetical protein
MRWRSPIAAGRRRATSAKRRGALAAMSATPFAEVFEQHASAAHHDRRRYVGTRGRTACRESCARRDVIDRWTQPLGAESSRCSPISLLDAVGREEFSPAKVGELRRLPLAAVVLAAILPSIGRSCSFANAVAPTARDQAARLQTSGTADDDQDAWSVLVPKALRRSPTAAPAGAVPGFDRRLALKAMPVDGAPGPPRLVHDPRDQQKMDDRRLPARPVA